MKQSLRLRWTLALVAVCLVEAALVAVAVRSSTERTFEQFVIEEAFDAFIGDVADAVRETGSIEAYRPTDRAPERPPPGPRPRGPRPLPREIGQRITFGLADTEGRVVLPFDGYNPGDTVSATTLAAGEPVEVDGRRLGMAFIPEDAAAALPPFPEQSPEARFIASSTRALAWALAGALAVAIVLALWLTRRTVRPLRDLTAAARRIASGDLRQSVEIQSNDEVGQLAAAFNAMSTRLAEATALRQRMTADISHDLRTPLTAVLGTLEAIESGALPATPERIATAHAEARRLARLVEDLHTLALADADELPLHPQRIAPTNALRHIAQLFEAEATATGITLTVEADAPPDVRADPDRLTQALGNLVGNALRHTSEGGRITLSAQSKADTVELSVVDVGEGIPPEMLPIVFERSVRADTTRTSGGAGLGLSIVRSLIEAMGGTVGATSTLGQGTTMTISLPTWAEEPRRKPS